MDKKRFAEIMKECGLTDGAVDIDAAWETRPENLTEEMVRKFAEILKKFGNILD